MIVVPLRYNISDWHQAIDCLSNSSRYLHIRVSDFVQNSAVEGTKLEVYHDQFGILFSYVVDAVGEIIDPEVSVLTTAQVLNELARFGFLITYDQKAHLPTAQLQFLVAVNQLGFDKLRLMTVLDPATSTARTYVIVFKIANHPDWLDNTATAYLRDFNQATADGTAFNVSTISESEKYRWDWLDYVANIEDILRDNS